jgi:acetate kinase
MERPPHSEPVNVSRESCSLLTMNGGSSSIRFALYDEVKPPRRRLNGKLDRVGLSGTNLTFNNSIGQSQDSRTIDPTDHRSAVAFLLDWLETQEVFASVKAVGHRVARSASQKIAHVASVIGGPGCLGFIPRDKPRKTGSS